MQKKSSKICKKFIFRERRNNKILLAGLVSIMIIIATTPLVFGIHEDTLVITFDPDADIDINVDITAYNFSTVNVNEWTNTTGELFTLYNNGTIAMDTEIKTNESTDEGDMDLNESTTSPGTDEYAIYIEDLQFPQYLNGSYATHGNYDEDIAPMAFKSFDICLLMGTNTTSNHSWQTTTIYFRGSINSS